MHCHHWHYIFLHSNHHISSTRLFSHKLCNVQMSLIRNDSQHLSTHISRHWWPRTQPIWHPIIFSQFQSNYDILCSYDWIFLSAWLKSQGVCKFSLFCQPFYGPDTCYSTTCCPMSISMVCRNFQACHGWKVHVRKNLLIWTLLMAGKSLKIN